MRSDTYYVCDDVNGRVFSNGQDRPPLMSYPNIISYYIRAHDMGASRSSDILYIYIYTERGIFNNNVKKKHT